MMYKVCQEVEMSYSSMEHGIDNKNILIPDEF